MLMEGDYVKVQRREKHSMPVDPNNKHWVNDKSKFGYKMLLKMGWSEGKGLGTQEQGMTEHIVQNKMEERVGLGATVDTSSNWLENTSAYSQLLSSLRNKFNSSPSSEQDASTVKDDEAVKPKCVMFAKRARAKSIRTKSKQDLAAILGVKPSEVSSDEDIPGSTDSDSESRKEKKSNKRKAEIEPVEELNIAVEAEEEQEKKKKKKKKSKRKQETEQEEEPVVLATPAEEEEVESKKDKKKKKSKKHREEVVQEEAVVEAEPVAELSEKKKKKKSKKHREEAVVEEEVQAEPEVEVSEKKKKKKKKNRDE